MTSWFRSWHGAPTDNKWLVIARRANVAPGIVSAIAWALFDYASQQDDRGSIDGFDVETYAAFSGFDEKHIVAVCDALKEKGLVEKNRLKSWEKRQPKREDNSSDRTRRYREKKKDSDAQVSNVTQCDAPDTEQIQITEQKKIKRVAAPVKPEDVSEGVWLDFLKQRKTKFTDTALAGIRREAEKAGWGLEDALREACARGWQSFKADWIREKTHETAQKNHRKSKSEQLDDILAEHLAGKGIADPRGGGPDLRNNPPVLRPVQHLRAGSDDAEEPSASVRGGVIALPRPQDHGGIQGMAEDQIRYANACGYSGDLEF